MTEIVSTGGDIDAYCTKCKLNLEHFVLAVVDGVVVKVKCKTCGSTHRFRGTPSARPRAAKKVGASAKLFVSVQAQWEAAVDSAQGPELPYDMASSFHEGDFIVHSFFGRGVVLKAYAKKCSVLFRDRERLLATGNK
jgi:hypothetical protein